jgi:hypothetical protein
MGRPVEVLGRDDAVFWPALIAVAVRNDVPGFGSVARTSVFNGSSAIIKEHLTKPVGEKNSKKNFAKKDN